MEERTSDEKMMSGIAYLGAFLCCLIPPLVIFFMKKDESEYIKYHCLQSLGIAVVAIVLGLVIGFGTLGLAFVAPPLTGPVTVASYGLNAVFCGYYIYLAIMVFQGKDVDVPVIGDFIQSNLMGG